MTDSTPTLPIHTSDGVVQQPAIDEFARDEAERYASAVVRLNDDSHPGLTKLARSYLTLLEAYRKLQPSQEQRAVIERFVSQHFKTFPKTCDALQELLAAMEVK